MNRERMRGWLLVLGCCVACSLWSGPKGQGEAKLFRFSNTIEQERPELNEETRALITAYRQQPTQQHREALRKQIAANDDAVIRRKEAKLATSALRPGLPQRHLPRRARQ